MNNESRASRGQQISNHYNALPDTDQDEPQDIIADLCHYLLSKGKDTHQIQQILASGLNHFNAEITGEHNEQ